ncbi:MAG: hypothetical protein DLM54_05255 [Acidimicrobiales bacterium]|nr:MAG: hypothetical protein DLM54_05255 [Acidimicrobiales bacterium]
MSIAAEPAAGRDHLELEIGGMTCASCAARIEKRLNRLYGASDSWPTKACTWATAWPPVRGQRRQGARRCWPAGTVHPAPCWWWPTP